MVSTKNRDRHFDSFEDGIDHKIRLQEYSLDKTDGYKSDVFSNPLNELFPEERLKDMFVGIARRIFFKTLKSKNPLRNDDDFGNFHKLLSGKCFLLGCRKKSGPKFQRHKVYPAANETPTKPSVFRNER